MLIYVHFYSISHSRQPNGAIYCPVLIVLYLPHSGKNFKGSHII